mmetsp:Transcript_15158/g.57629  ORF Transcript_15158/g.57629 Transcript_15158/m.57629 type:complete len:110 (+) Transcript_15158:707-1036(+)
MLRHASWGLRALRFRTEVADHTYKKSGFPSSNYGMSKLGVIAYSRVLARENPDIDVFSCCPGWCQTDMSSNSGYKTAYEGSQTPFMLGQGLLGSGASGGFFTDEHQAEW